jgi:16S rRNA processing protein RimM
LEKFIKIGKIVKAQGIKGEVKVFPLTDDVSRFNALKNAFVGGKPFKVGYARPQGGEIVIKLSGIDDRNAAETLKGKFVEVERADAVPLSEGEYFIADLIGAVVFEGEKRLGTVKEILNYGASDIIVAECGGEAVMFPFLEKVIENIDVERGEIRLNGEEFAKIAVKENGEGY